MRVLAVDPGAKYLGVAVSDPSGLIARPLTTLRHESRDKDAARLAALAAEQQAELIVVGYPLNSEGQPGTQARHAERLAAAIGAAGAIPVVLHDESFSSLDAEGAMRAVGKTRRARREQVHAVAAAAILQSYLDGHPGETQTG